MRQRLLIFGGLLLAAALAVGGQVLFRPGLRFPFPPTYAWPLATAATLAAIVLFAILAPGRADDPGLRPYPPPTLPEPRLAPVVTAEPIAVDDVEAVRGLPLPRTTTLPRLGIWQVARVVGILLAIALSYFGVVIFQRKLPFLQMPEGRLLLLGSAVTVASMVLFGLLGPRPDPASAPGELPAHERPALVPTLARPWFLGWFAPVLGLYGYAMGYYQGAGETRAVVLAWVASMALLLVAVMRSQVGWGWRRWLPSREEIPWLLALSGILAIALVLRTVRLTTLPYDLDGDFASYGVQARAFITGPNKRLFTVGWANIPMIGYLPPIFTMLLFGTGQVGLNMSGVIEGMLSIVGVYLLGRDFFSQRVGVLAAGISTILYVHIHFSRVSAYMDPLPFMVFGLYLLLRGLRN
ncbi:MAG: glycosyltransferase family 39 protein, partial [Anaerolineae bacterium]|nr:glycosyltransferase family 39 protein [Anaerolineae bacterium]